MVNLVENLKFEPKKVLRLSKALGNALHMNRIHTDEYNIVTHKGGNGGDFSDNLIRVWYIPDFRKFERISTEG